LSEGLAAPLGVQVTFFRLRTPVDPQNPSRFAAHQLLFAHAALADAARGSLLFEERVARAGFGALAAEHDTDVRLSRWRLQRESTGAYRCEIPARSFALRFTATPTQPLLLQGEAGYSRKGPQPQQASYYYSQPQLRLQAQLRRDGRELAAAGVAWLDHEWASSVLDAAAAGWDWIGMNLDDGSALAAFRIRRRDGSGDLYAYGAWRAATDATPRRFAPTQVRFVPLSFWRSPRTGARYPVAQRIELGERVFETQPLMADQELVARATGGTVYWEGASTLLEGGRPVGRGYLELTGYAAPMAL
ncbi:MAG: carotenoid 1,2-hydratase, partial [Burkholderiaceae bacterium]|nr:carotenoid 1,2-hydratase [Burkholderiaceae bacterium]